MRIPATAAALALIAMAARPAQDGAVLASMADDGEQSDGYSGECAVTPNGRFAAFWSQATNLVADDSGGTADVFVRDLRAKTTGRVSVDSDGVEGNGGSRHPSISANGRWVLFQSAADNLVPDDTNGLSDVFVHDRKTGETRRVSVAEDGGEGDGASYVYGASLSSSGRYAVFYSNATNYAAGDGNGESDVFLADLRKGTLTLVSATTEGVPVAGESADPSVSANGRFVAFYGNAGDFPPGTSNGKEHVYVRDRKTGDVRRASVDADGNPGSSDSYDPVVSSNGKVVAFYSYAASLVAGDTNGQTDAFVHDFGAGTTTRISLLAGGGQAQADTYNTAITQNGKTVLFYTEADLLPADTNGTGDVYAWDARSGALRFVSHRPDGLAADGYSWLYGPSLAPTGRWLSIISGAQDLVDGDENGQTDVFVLDPR
jgi:Tol biopolymer transport system component